jgi:CelD/BcsL family acetyltransferase involved in cellulose biosynthesis
MAQSAALEKLELVDRAAEGAGPAVAGEGFAIAIAHDLAEVEAAWRALTPSVESPGQNFDFIRLWIDALRIPPADCFFIVASDAGTPVALMPLQRRWDKGIRVLSWFPGAHVGCDAPIIDASKLAAMGSAQRRRLWIEMLRGVSGADVVHLRSVPRLEVNGVELFAELGQWLEAETLYRAHFSSFADADRTQRNKSRRKHDRQQGDKLEAMGTVGFEEIGNGPAARAVLDTMFAQRAARFVEMGVSDPFDVPAVRAFYDSTVDADSRLPVKLHVLRLNGEIVATRYNIAHGDRLFCLISSMSEDPALRPGSPGKQCLLRVMQTVFEAGYRIFDMGEGLTDEKRHWCNEHIPVRHHYVPITRRGAIAAAAHRRWQQARAQIKSDPRLLALAKKARGAMLRLSGEGAPVAPAPAADAE